MPRGDGTGPFGQGAGTGRGRGMGAGQGRMSGNRPGAGPGGKCVCPLCGAEVPHVAGVPCYDAKCPKCNSPMRRA